MYNKRTERNIKHIFKRSFKAKIVSQTNCDNTLINSDQKRINMEDKLTNTMEKPADITGKTIITVRI